VKFATPRRDGGDLLDLTPLIDVVFLLLIFFMVSTTFIREPGGIRVDLPHSDTQEFIQEGEEVVVKISDEGTIYVDDVPVSEDALKIELQRAVKKDPGTTVIIKADRSVEHGEVVRVMDLAKRIGLVKMAVATEGTRERRAGSGDPLGP
jgi:biopolymer transport protein ExbD